MRPIESILVRSVLLLILCGFGLSFMLVSYGVLRVIRISVDWVTWTMGSGLLMVCAAICASLLWPGVLPARLQGLENIAAAMAFLVAVYASSQWLSRQWFLLIKKNTGRGLKQFSKDVLMFFRKHHVLLGWIVVAGSLAHLIFFLPRLTHIQVYEEVTGFIAIGLLGLMTLLGLWLWIETAWRKRRMPRMVHTIHASLTIAFFIVLFLHI